MGKALNVFHKAYSFPPVPEESWILTGFLKRKPQTVWAPPKTVASTLSLQQITSMTVVVFLPFYRLGTFRFC